MPTHRELPDPRVAERRRREVDYAEWRAARDRRERYLADRSPEQVRAEDEARAQTSVPPPAVT